MALLERHKIRIVERKWGQLFTRDGAAGIVKMFQDECARANVAIQLHCRIAAVSKQELMIHRKERTEMSTFLSSFLPKRFAKKWCGLYFPSKPMNRTSEKEFRSAAERLHDWRVTPQKRDGYGAAEVTGGGVDTDEVSSKTMESRKMPGLFFAGEVLDVTGELGGYNLQWAWSSGWAAGQFV